MPKIISSVAANGLPIHRVALAGTRATTILVGFDAGARTERPDENGMAHFLEHLVFKGGQIYDDYRKVNETAERMGGSLNAYTSHDLVAFHITVRAESAMEAIDLLTDFVGRPKIDPAELDKERGVVIQEIQRYKDQPAAVAEELIDRAHFGDHPLGRTVLGPEDHLRSFSREAIVAFRERRWSGARGGAFVVGNVDHVPGNGKVDELFARFPDLPESAEFTRVLTRTWTASDSCGNTTIDSQDISVTDTTAPEISVTASRPTWFAGARPPPLGALLLAGGPTAKLGFDEPVDVAVQDGVDVPHLDARPVVLHQPVGLQDV